MKSYFIFFALFLIMSCSKEDNTTSNTASNQNFPHEVGNQWIYKYDNGSNVDQYIDVDIVGSVVLPDGQNATIWTSTLQDGANQRFLLDSSYVVVDDEKAVFYAPPCLPCIPSTIEEKRRYMFPLQVGGLWFTDLVFGDTTKVLNDGSLTVPAGRFDNTFQLSRTIGYVTNSYTYDTIWLTPNIGMTKYFQNQYSLGPVPGNGVWELASYQLK